MKGYGGQSRRQIFDRFDRPVLQALPTDRYVYAAWSKARVNIDYHMDVDGHSIRFLTRSFTRSSRSVSRPPPSRSSCAANGSGCICAVRSAAASRQSRSTCRKAPPRASGMDALAPDSLGGDHRAEHGPRWRRRFSRVARTRSKGIGPASGSCVSGSAMAPRDSKPPPRPRPGRGRQLLQAGRRDPQTRAGPPAPGARRRRLPDRPRGRM